MRGEPPSPGALKRATLSRERERDFLATAYSAGTGIARWLYMILRIRSCKHCH